MAYPKTTAAQPAAKNSTAKGRWSQLIATRQGFITRCERYAALTLPKVCLPDTVDQNSESVQYDWTSVGAQAVNHLKNKISMALFSPSRPFFRLDPDAEMRATLQASKIPEEKLREVLAQGESDAVKMLDRKAIRPKLNNLLGHLIVTGNALLDLSEDMPRVMSLKNYAAKRSVSGKLQELLIHEVVCFDELEEKVQAAVARKGPEQMVSLIKWCVRKGDQWELSTWVDEQRLPPAFDGRFAEKDFPYFALTWDLSDEADYGTGLVEDYSGDFNALSVMAEAEIRSAVLASEFRWLADPSGITDVNDFKQSVNGDVLPGRKEDLTLVHMTSTSALQEIASTSEKVIRRIGAAFLLGSATTRDAERVTAEELRMQAQELESSLGGVYSRLAVDLQVPLARWLLKEVGVEIAGTKLQPTIITGLDALSRSADAQNLVLALQDLAAIATLPEGVQARLNIAPIITTLLAARGINPSQYLKPEEQVAQEQQAAAQAAQQAQAQQVAVEQGAKAAANAAKPQGTAPQ